MAPSQQQSDRINMDDDDELLLDKGMSQGSEGSNVRSAQPVLPKPTRPLTAYHLYFQLERELIIQTTKSDNDDDDDHVEKFDTRPVGLQLDPEMPLRYHDIHLSPFWYASGKEKRSSSDKRKHRKTHGKIAFLDLSKHVASRWATLEETDPETKDYCTRVAKRELDSYKVKVKEYKESLKSAPTDSLPSSFSSAATGATLSSSGTSSFTSATSPKKYENDLPFAQSHGSGSSGALTITTSNVSNFQICADFHPGWLDRMEVDEQAPTHSRNSGGTEDTTSITMNNRLSNTMDSSFQFNRDSLSRWRSDSLPDMNEKQEQVSAPRVAGWSRNSIGGEVDTTSKNRRASSRAKRSGMSRSMVSAPVAKNEFSFHPVECDSTDSFLKKYRKQARRTSLFSLRPLHQQVIPSNLKRSFTGGASTNNVALNDVIECENVFNQPEPRHGLGSIQMKLRDELDERLAQVWKGGRDATSRSSQFFGQEGMHSDVNMKRAAKRMSCEISESYGRNSESQIEFTCNDANMLLRALSDEKSPHDIATPLFTDRES